MASISLFSLLVILGILISLPRNASDVSEQTDLQTYIVHLRAPDHQNFSDRETRESWYTSLLSASKANANKKSRIIHFYHHVFPGFAAKLTPVELESLKKTKGFVSAWPEQLNYLQTTHSPAFLGLQPNVGFWRDSDYGRGIIIGVLDTGIRPDHPSFGDEGMPLPPNNWKGRCESFSCNRKLIGAISFGTTGTPQDRNGHGTHVAGTAAGNFVPGANVYGNAYGTAVGIAPRAHLAMYNVCLPDGTCPDGYILAGADAAISDGVDVLSISLAGPSRPFYTNAIAIGGFGAMKRGIFVSAAAGNRGPSPRTTGNEAPWLLTVGASSINRQLTATVVLGNNSNFDEEALFQPKNFPPNQFPLVYPGLSNTDRDVLFCNSSSLGNYTVRGKIVLCRTGGVGAARNVRNFGGEGMILMSDATHGDTIPLQNIRVLPVSQVSYADGQQIIGYIRTSINPTAALVYKGTVIGNVHAPAVASFSSRGPSVESPGILKPDIIGPGLNILAAWPFSVEGNPAATSTFNFLSGTSMACPHLSGVAALLKKAHPNWSPAAIKSAIMTTAYQTNLGNNPIEDETHNPANVFALGAGHVDPSRATNPGLIYDIQPDDYIPYLCGLGYTNQQVQTIVGSSVDCSRITPIKEAELNYPSFSVRLSASSTQTYTRTVTNVGGANINYSVGGLAPHGVQVVVSRGSLFFSQQNQKLTYQVTFTRLPGTPTGNFQGFITWASNSHLVRSPIAAVLY